MADRASAALFADVFRMLAGEGPADRAAFARRLWGELGGYDFTPRQMGCDAALLKLGLARRGVDPEYPDDGEVTLYGSAEPTSQCGQCGSHFGVGPGGGTPRLCAACEDYNEFARGVLRGDE